MAGWSHGIECAEDERIQRIQKRLGLSTVLDSHVTSLDILRIGRNAIGYRHVSSEEAALKNSSEGISYGCSLNISLIRDENDRSIFAGMDDKVRWGEFYASLIRMYEKAIDQFILTSYSVNLIFAIISASKRQKSSIANRVVLINTSPIYDRRFLTAYNGWPKLDTKLAKIS